MPGFAILAGALTISFRTYHTAPMRRYRVLSLSICFMAAACGHAPPGSARSDEPARVDSGVVRIGSAQIFYQTAGRGSAVVLLHGGNLDSRMWDAQFLPLAREHRVIRYDARGWGKSSLPLADSAYAAHEDLRTLLDSLHIARASLVGLSLGGRIAIDFALRYPAMVDRLVLASPGLSGWPFLHRDTSWFADGRRARDRGDYDGVALAWLESDFMRPAMQHPELRAQLRTEAAANGRYWKMLLTKGDPERPAEPQALGRTGAISAPTLLVIGTGDNADILLIADTLMKTVPGIRRVDFAGAGHMVNMEEPDRFTELVRDFLRTPLTQRPVQR